MSACSCLGMWGAKWQVVVKQETPGINCVRISETKSQSLPCLLLMAGGKKGRQRERLSPFNLISESDFTAWITRIPFWKEGQKLRNPEAEQLWYFPSSPLNSSLTDLPKWCGRVIGKMPLVEENDTKCKDNSTGFMNMRPCEYEDSD